MDTSLRPVIHNFNSYEEMVQAMKEYSQQNKGTQFLCCDNPMIGTTGYVTEDSSHLYQIELNRLWETKHTLSDEHKELLRTAEGRSRIARLCSS